MSHCAKKHWTEYGCKTSVGVTLPLKNLELYAGVISEKYEVVLSFKEGSGASNSLILLKLTLAGCL